MSPRARRLFADQQLMVELAAQAPIEFTAHGIPPERYHVCLQATGLALDAGGEPVLRRLHRYEIYLHLDYPRLPPIVTWQTPIFHPNILPPTRNGGVCIGGWGASEGLADLCRRIERMVRYQSFNASDALDPDAAAWACEHGIEEGVDLEAVLDSPVSPTP